jgi:hypothetical protein
MPRRHEDPAIAPVERPAAAPAVQPAAPGVSNALLGRMSGADRTRALSARGAGNHALARALLQRDPDPPDGGQATASPPGRGQSTPFGEYWIVPDGTNQSYAGVIGEQITEGDFAALQTVWNKLNDGSGQVKITEADDRGTDHAGFKAKILGCFGQLLSMPAGRALVAGLVDGSQTVTIGPTSTRKIASATRGAGSLENADGTAGAGGSTTIRFDADLTDTSVVAFDAAGHELAAPIWSILGHELIHAEHNAAGRNRRNLAPRTSAAYGNREEEETIATGSGVTENALRAEHGLPARFGHGARDKR